MRVLQVGGDPDLVEEAFGAQDGGQLGMENLDRDLALVLDIVGQVDRRHAAAAELTLDRVAVGQCGRQAVQHVVAHKGASRVRTGPSRQTLSVGLGRNEGQSPERVWFGLLQNGVPTSGEQRA